MCCVVFNKTNVILSHLIASLFLQFEKFYVKFSVCFCLISVKVSEFIYLEIYLRKQWLCQKHCNSSCSPAANGNSVQCKYWISFQLSRKYYLNYVCKYLHQILCMIYTDVIVMHKAGLIYILENWFSSLSLVFLKVNKHNIPFKDCVAILWLNNSLAKLHEQDCPNSWKV